MALQRSNTRATNPELREDLDLLQQQVDEGGGGGGSVPDASETVKGKVELATIAEAVAGVDTVRAVTPAGLSAAIAGIPALTLTRADVALSAVSQSSTYTGTASGSVSNMTDGVGTTGTGTNNGANEWIAVEWSTTKLIIAVRLGGGTIPGFGATSAYQQIAATLVVLQYWNGSAWRNWVVTSTSQAVENSGINQFVEIPGVPVMTQKLRLYRAGSANYIATTEFVPIELLVG